VLPPQFRALIPSVSKGCLQPYMIFQVRATPPPPLQQQQPSAVHYTTAAA
jgi:hypothetical protein